jgi:hypothetical protein
MTALAGSRADAGSRSRVEPPEDLHKIAELQRASEGDQVGQARTQLPSLNPRDGSAVNPGLALNVSQRLPLEFPSGA